MLNRKIITLLVGVGLSFSPTVAFADTEAVNSEHKYFSEQQLAEFDKEKIPTHLKIYSSDGVEEFKIKDDLTFKEFFNKHSLDLNKFQTMTGEKIDGSQLLSNSPEIIKVSRDAKTEVITLPYPETKVETDDLYVGETRVRTEGKDGKAIKTVLYTFDNLSLDSDKPQADEATVKMVERPIKKIVEVGTKEPEPEPEPESEPETDTTYTVGINQGNQNQIRSATPPVRDLPANPVGKSVIETAMSYVGYPYFWGGTTPAGFDCSGFVQYVHAKHGINLPRVSDAQGAAGTRVSTPQPGDLVVWPGQHIAIYIGNGQIVHASNPRDGVKVGPLYGSYYFSRLG